MDFTEAMVGMNQRVRLDVEGNVILPKPPGRLAPATLSEGESYGQRQCASCLAPGCTLWCSACDITDIGKIRTFYCSYECQKNHRSEHKDNCTARLHVARASSILFALFYGFEKATHIKATPKIVERDGVLTMGREEDFPRAWTGGHLFIKFPEEALPAGTPKDVADSVLLDQTCAEIATTSKPLLSLIMEPFVKSMQVATGTTRNPARVLYAYQFPSMMGNGGVDWAHSVLKIRAGKSEVYALDLSGAQFGWKDILYDWNTYAKYRSAPDIELCPIAQMNQVENMVLSMCAPNSVHGAQKELRRRVMDQYVSQLRSLLNEHFLSLRPEGDISAITKLVKKKPEDFMAAKEKILQRALEYPQVIVNGLGNVGRMYMSPTFEECVILTEEEAVRYAKVWFEEGDPRVKDLSKTKLQALWRKRMSR